MKQIVRSSEHSASNQAVLIKVFNSGYIIALLLFLAGSLSSFCDGVIAARGLGVVELAAIGITYPYAKMMECISLLLSSGSQVVIGRKIGQNKFEEVPRVFYTSLVFTGALSIFIAAAVCLFAAPLSGLFGASAEGGTLRPTMDYLIALAIGAPAHLLTLYLIPLFQLDEKKKLLNITTFVMTAVNVVLNILFVMNHMGIRGIGLSTSISYYVALAILSTHFFEKKQGILLQGRFGVSGEDLAETIKEGSPSAFKNVTSIVFNMVLNNIIKTMGTTEVMAAFSVLKMTKFIYCSVTEAIVNPVRMIQSMLLEERDRKTQREVFKYSISRSLLYSLLMLGLLLAFGRNLYALIVPADVLNDTMTMMVWTVVGYVMNAFVCYYLAYFQAINQKKVVYSISFVLNIVSLPFFYLLIKGYGTAGVGMGHAAQSAITAAYVLGCAWLMGRKNKTLIDKLLVVPMEASDDLVYDCHIQSTDEAYAAAVDFDEICNKGIADEEKAYYCSLALEEIVFNILEYQKAHDLRNPNIDVHIIVYEDNTMVMRVKDCSEERNPFVKYEYSRTGDDLENMGIRIVKSFAKDVKYSFIYGVNFITIIV